MEEKNEKYLKILEAAKKEFAKYGYEKASTARICENAGVSKGLLFHHFKTKKGLYLDICKNSIEYFAEKMFFIEYDDCKTYYDYILKMAKLKLKYASEDYEEYEVILEAMYKTPPELRVELDEIFEEYINRANDLSKTVFERYELREGVDHYKAWEVVNEVSNILQRKFWHEVDDAKKRGKTHIDVLDNMTNEMMKYLDIIFYGIAVK